MNGPGVERTATQYAGASTLGLDVAATVGLAVFSFVVAIGFGRVFADWSFVGDALAIVIVGHGLSLLGRRLHVPGLAAVPIIALVLTVLLAWLYYPDTFAAFLPTHTTWDIAGADISLVRDQFGEAVAPVEYIGGWAALAGIAIAVVVALSDVFAFRAHGTGEAVVPGGVLFVFIAAIGVDRDRVAYSLGLVAAGVVTIAVLRARAARPPRTVLGAVHHPLTTTLPAAAIAGGADVNDAGLVGPNLPGAGAEALYDTNGSGGGTTEVVSPLVDIRSRLVNRSNNELFVVTATAESYWRVSALPQFDGSSWGLPARPLAGTSGQLNEAPPGAVINEQSLLVAGLGGRLVPAAADPVQCDDCGLRFNAETSTLVRTDRELATGDRFEIVSAMPIYEPDLLRATSSTAPPDPIYLDLPDGFPSSVAETAAEVTAGAATTYDAVLALQNWFRTNFQYSLEVPSGHSTSAIEAFLRQRVGYCEQFAGTMAAMLRSLGIPARVAVGFTPGTTNDTGDYSVLGRNAHAWPEVWFDGYGWVAFEPTPGRGSPTGEAVTGVAPAQDIGGPGPGGSPGEPGATPAPTGTVTPNSNPVVNPGVVPDDQDGGLAPTPGAAPAPTTSDGADGGAWGWLGALGILAALAAVIPPGVRWIRRQRLRDDPAERVLQLWHRATRAIEGTGVRLDPSQTPMEQARTAAPRIPVAAQPLLALAEVATAATYASTAQLHTMDLIPADHARGPIQWCRDVEEVAVDSLTTGGRVLRYFTNLR